MARPYLWTRKRRRCWSQIYIANFWGVEGCCTLQPARCKDIIQSWNDRQTIKLYASFCNVLILQICNIHNVYVVTCDLLLKDSLEDLIYLDQGIKDGEITT